mmetsp:Transcript_39704/g.74528  ORF Transcript_39704/g.74528 Transcript_39704/m.74528 type:complete len:269 (+) Transcript_39704:2398-3204(+)
MWGCTGESWAVPDSMAEGRAMEKGAAVCPATSPRVDNRSSAVRSCVLAPPAERSLLRAPARANPILAPGATGCWATPSSGAWVSARTALLSSLPSLLLAATGGAAASFNLRLSRRGAPVLIFWRRVCTICSMRSVVAELRAAAEETGGTAAFAVAALADSTGRNVLEGASPIPPNAEVGVGQVLEATKFGVNLVLGWGFLFSVFSRARRSCCCSISARFCQSFPCPTGAFPSPPDIAAEVRMFSFSFAVLCAVAMDRTSETYSVTFTK